jgi:insulysin
MLMLPTADTDATELAKLTKQAMTTFYASFISPASPTRSKLSVHLQAQSKPKEPSLDEKKASAVAALQVILTEHKLDAKLPDLTAAIKAAPSADAIPDAVAKFLSDVLKLKSDVAGKVLDEAKAAMGVADSGLAAEPKVLGDGDVDMEGAKDARTPVLVRDIHAWKAGMQVSKGVRPVRQLEEFVEVGGML